MAAGRIAFCPTFGAGMRRIVASRSRASPDIAPDPRRLPSIVDALRNLIANGVPLLAGSDAGVPEPFLRRLPRRRRRARR